MDRRDEILNELTALLREIFVAPDLLVTPATTARDVAGWDSMKQIEINVAAEERFGVRFSAREVDNLRSVGDLVEALARKTS